MLSGLVPTANNQDEAWRDTALEQALQCAQDNEMREVLSWSLSVRQTKKLFTVAVTKSNAEHNNTPADHVT
jgi:hypothetical protein